MTNSLIEIRDLSVSFPSEVGTVQAVRNISLDIRAGEVLGIARERNSFWLGHVQRRQLARTKRRSNVEISRQSNFDDFSRPALST
ncbi:MAG: hypothetical protein RIS81_1466 [Actinomycetota bacterium]